MDSRSDDSTAASRKQAWRRGCFYLPVLLLSFLTCSSVIIAQTESLVRQEQQAIQRAIAQLDPSIVRIETVGGVDLVGDILTSTGPTTGVIISEDGWILTSSFNFVSNPATVIVSVVTNGEAKQYAAEVVSHDKAKMLTLLKIKASDLKPVTLSPKSEMRVGQRAIALGRTFDPAFPNVSTGIVSALGRVNGKAIQTDAKTSPVNYGGPLIDLTGRCLGIIVPLSPQQAGEAAGVEWYDSGIGFAIPLEDVERVLDRLKAGEDLEAGLMGIGFEADGPLAGEAKIMRVRPQSPADRAGIEVDDVITTVDGVEVKRLIQLRQVLGNRYGGETIDLTVRRGDETFEKQITLVGELVPYEFTSLGLLPVRQSTKEQPRGIEVRYVYENSPLAKAEIRPGDLILKVDDQETLTPQDLAQFLTTRLKGATVKIEYERDGMSQESTVILDAFPEGDAHTNVPPSDIPPGDVAEETKLGRFNQKLDGSDQAFWVNVPENYNPDYQHGLLVWVHPAGKTMEAEILQFWKDLAAERGLILVGPRAEEISGWAPTEEEYVKDVVGWVQANYSVDPARIAVMGIEDSGVFASRLAFKYRDIFRGLLLFESPLRLPPPDSDPEHRLMIMSIGATETTQRERIEKSVEFLRKQKFPTELVDAEEAGKFSFDLVNSLVQWIDSLDRL